MTSKVRSEEVMLLLLVPWDICFGSPSKTSDCFEAAALGGSPGHRKRPCADALLSLS